jgi:hypothetical protein
MIARLISAAEASRGSVAGDACIAKPQSSALAMEGAWVACHNAAGARQQGTRQVSVGDQDRLALDEACASCGHAIDALRIAEAPLEVLQRVKALLDQAAALLAPHARPGPHVQSVQGLEVERFWEAHRASPQEAMPYSPIIGRLNPVSPRLEFRVEGDRLEGHGSIPVRFVGAPQTVHGGIVAAVLDELMGLVNFVNGEGAFTGTMSVRYHRPTPIQRELTLSAATVARDGRKIRSHAEIRCDGEVTASAEGLFIRPRS